MFKPFSLNIKGQLTTYNHPVVMGILNVTPDSFYCGSRAFDSDNTRLHAEKLISDGADMIDIGGYSSRPGAESVSPDEELRRIEQGINTVKKLSPTIPISIDTFRADVALKAVRDLGADIINDISGGELDDKMLETIAKTKTPYIMMHMRGTPANMQQFTNYNNVTAEVVEWLSRRLARFSLAGADDIIIDPGFGFSKTTAQNFEMLSHMELFNQLQRPVLVGISRKSMIHKTLNITPDEALNGTTVLNTLALERGASVLRVHDVSAARQAVKLVAKLNH